MRGKKSEMFARFRRTCSDLRLRLFACINYVNTQVQAQTRSMVAHKVEILNMHVTNVHTMHAKEILQR